jgi:hypothetical protein
MSLAPTGALARSEQPRFPTMEPFARYDASSLVISFYVSSIVLLSFLLSSPRFYHWFVLPVLACGVLIGIDASDWARGRLDLFDPVGILGVVGFHLFFLAPLLQISWGYSLRYVTPLGDWRPWLGGMAALNAVGILLYRVARRIVGRRPPRPRSAGAWTIDHRRMVRVLPPLLALSLVLQTFIYASYGGIAGYIAAFTASETAFVGDGPLFMVSESFPMVALLGYAAVVARRNEGRPKWSSIFMVLLTFLALRLLFGGLRGSRVHTIWGLFWAVGVVHLWIRPVPKKLLIVGAAFVLVFMYAYGFYKNYGLEGLESVSDPARRAQLQERSGRTFDAVILGDLGRSDVHAYLLYRLTSPISGSDYEYARGRTYIGAAVLPIPQSIWPDRPPTKVKEGTEALFGRSVYESTSFRASNVYGITGEAMLNFGPLAVPLAFVPLGLLVGWARRRIAVWRASDDSRLLLAPYLVLLCIVALILDSENVVYFVIAWGAVPGLALWLGSAKRAIDSPYRGRART